MLEMEYSGYGGGGGGGGMINTMSADAPAPKVIRASAGMVLVVWDRQHLLLSLT